MPRPGNIATGTPSIELLRSLPADLEPLGTLLTNHIDNLGKHLNEWTERQESVSRKLLAASNSQQQILDRLDLQLRGAHTNKDDHGSGGNGQGSCTPDSPVVDLSPVPAALKVEIINGDETPQATFLSLDEHQDDADRKQALTRAASKDAASVRSFPLRDLWSKTRARTYSLQRSGTNGLWETKSGGQADEIVSVDEEAKVDDTQKGWWTTFIAMPGSRYRLSWDMIGGILIGYDMFVIPLQAFDPPETTFTTFMEMTTLFFWTLNVIATLTVGYISGGMVVVSPVKILTNYLKGWFIIDVVVLVPDYVFMFVSSAASSGGGDSVKMLRWLRLARTIRLVRLMKLKWIMDAINDYLDSEYSSIIVSIAKMLLILFVLCHFISCVWFLLASIQDESERTWVNNNREFSDVPWDMQYLVALHWAITQFTPASMHVQPHNKLERTFAILIVFFALVGFAYVVGSITGSIAQLRTMTEQAAKDFWLLRRYLRKNQVNPTLSLRITKFVEHVHARSLKRMGMDQVRLLKTLSRQLMEELHCAINLPHISIHPLFGVLGDRSVYTLNRVATECVSHHHLARGDTMFEVDQHGTNMYFIASGRIKYTRIIDGDEEVEIVEHGKGWISEQVLWTAEWFHVGEATANSEVEALLISPKKFEEILSEVKPMAAAVSEYGRKIIEWITREEHLNDVIQGDEAFARITGFLPRTLM
eukprot:TRINITY_DN9724_c0_g2_i1.p1 TRINITY_DN9724_c0_g2~~TRINITY_DN9724_c0_g2_i1.p1  ORF type:complete len:726 (-),score=109.06 TRINITY_DN9724_c0_g2_i1:448-2559(-)